MTVLMPGIRTVFIHNITSPKFRASVFSKSNRAARWVAHIGYVQQAKNREFEGVVVIWPYQVGGDIEHKRRLLYNAITQAKRWSNIIVQGQSILAAPPFA
jgi:DNA helicase IV